MPNWYFQLNNLEVAECDIKFKSIKLVIMAKKKKEHKVSIPEEVLMQRIYLIRDKKVMLDRDLAELYGVQTKRLKERVRRNIERFPEDFMFEMTKEELENWRSQFASSNKEKMGLRYPPFVFTEHGVLMLSSVLNSQRAIEVNIRIVRVFTKMKEMLFSHKELFHKLEKIEKRLDVKDHEVKVLFEYLKKLMAAKDQEETQSKRKRIGYKRDK